MNEYFEIPLNTVYAVVPTLAVFISVFMAAAYYAMNRRFLDDLL